MRNTTGIKGTSETLAPAKERPILFSTPMVEAILDGRKRQTRRFVKSPLNSRMRPGRMGDKACIAPFQEMHKASSAEEYDKLAKEAKWSPYGHRRDLLWVREEHYRYGHWERNGLTKLGNEKWRFVADKEDEPIYYDPYEMPHSFWISRDKNNPESPHWYKRLARFMPKTAARTWLRVVDVRVERVQEISEGDAIAEGVEWVQGILHKLYYNYVTREFGILFPCDSFESLWQSINGKGSWDMNPWVWVVEFERHERDARAREDL